MAVSDDEKQAIAQAIQLKRELVRLRIQIDREMKAKMGPKSRMDGRPVNPDSLPPEIREKYLQHQEAERKLTELRRDASPGLRSFIDPQIAC
ncbi:MAG: hypothetical protein QGH66_07175 [Dehalococcoidia bacterium]|jgi:hypothetical protein|nr:hypothetical protein [Dehalococcoidia bacterium]MDP7470284.1 hypothetical protein [Dehalococcoidia bacterium]